jgi:hypothetical protein
MAHLRILTSKCAGDAKVPGNYRERHIQKYKWGRRVGKRQPLKAPPASGEIWGTGADGFKASTQD